MARRPFKSNVTPGKKKSAGRRSGKKKKKLNSTKGVKSGEKESLLAMAKTGDKKGVVLNHQNRKKHAGPNQKKTMSRKKGGVGSKIMIKNQRRRNKNWEKKCFMKEIKKM